MTDFTDEDLILPDVQPDRAWAEHLGMPRLIAEVGRLRGELEKAQDTIYHETAY